MKDPGNPDWAKYAQNEPLGMAFIDSPSGLILQVNHAYCDIVGYEQKYLVGRSWTEFFCPENTSRNTSAIQTLFDTGIPQSVAIMCNTETTGELGYVNAIIASSSHDSRQPGFLILIPNQPARHFIPREKKIRSDEQRRRREEVMNSLVMVSRFRDRETGEHLRRTRSYMRLMLEALGPRQPFSARGIELVSNASMLHDIGKIGIPDSILLKPGRLSSAEMHIMKTHTTLGARALNETMRTMHGDTALLYAREIAEFHHERWDGSGYPYGFIGERIPLPARIMAIIDVYDALRSVRPYKSAICHRESIRIIASDCGRFDPSLIRVFLDLESCFAEIAEREKDTINPFQ